MYTITSKSKYISNKYMYERFVTICSNIETNSVTNAEQQKILATLYVFVYIK